MATHSISISEDVYDLIRDAKMIYRETLGRAFSTNKAIDYMFNFERVVRDGLSEVMALPQEKQVVAFCKLVDMAMNYRPTIKPVRQYRQSRYASLEDRMWLRQQLKHRCGIDDAPMKLVDSLLDIGGSRSPEVDRILRAHAAGRIDLRKRFGVDMQTEYSEEERKLEESGGAYKHHELEEVPPEGLETLEELTEKIDQARTKLGIHGKRELTEAEKLAIDSQLAAAHVERQPETTTKQETKDERDSRSEGSGNDGNADRQPDSGGDAEEAQAAPPIPPVR